MEEEAEEVLQDGRSQGLDGLALGEESLPPVGGGAGVAGEGGAGRSPVRVGQLESREKAWNMGACLENEVQWPTALGAPWHRSRLAHGSGVWSRLSSCSVTQAHV